MICIPAQIFSEFLDTAAVLVELIEVSQLLSQLPSLDKQSVNFTGTKLFYLALINKRGRARPAKRLPCLALHRNFTKKWKMTKGHE